MYAANLFINGKDMARTTAESVAEVAVAAECFGWCADDAGLRPFDAQWR